MGGFDAGPDHRRGARRSAVCVRGGPALLGQPVQEHAADDDHPVRDHRRGGDRWPRGRRSTTPARLPPCVLLAAGRRGRGRPVRARRGDAGGPRAAGRHLGAHSRTTAGAIMGLYSVFLAVGQIAGSLIGGVAARAARASTGCFVATLVLLGIAAPAARPSCAATSTASARRRAPAAEPTAEPGPAVAEPWRRWCPPASPAAHAGRSSRPTTSRPRPGWPSCAAGGSCRGRRDRDQRRPGRGDAQRLWHRRRRVLAHLGRGRRRAGRPQRVRALARRRRTRRAARTGPGPAIPLRGPLGITVPGAVRSWGDAHGRFGRLSRDAVLAPAIELARRRASRPGTGFIHAVEATDAAWVDEAIGPSRVPARLPAARAAVAARRAGPPAGAGRDALAAPGRRRASTRSTTAISASGRRARPRRGRLADRGRATCAAHRIDVGRRRSRRLPRRPGHDPPAQQLGRRRPGAAQRSWRGSTRRRRPVRSGRGVTDAALDPPAASRRPSSPMADRDA